MLAALWAVVTERCIAHPNRRELPWTEALCLMVVLVIGEVCCGGRTLREPGGGHRDKPSLIPVRCTDEPGRSQCVSLRVIAGHGPILLV